LIDSQYRIGEFSHFSYFDRHSLRVRENFLDHARSGDLAALSWIDPNFVDFNYYGPAGSNDDHPPSDITAGQELVFKLYDAVVRSPAWPRTLLVITYDEHGGFYDHVTPPGATDASPSFRSYGVRVPAIIVSPWLEPGSTSNLVFDHTSIIKTILTRFCRRATGISDMGLRVDAAQTLAPLLTRATPRAPEPEAAYAHLVDHFVDWHAALARQRLRQGIAPTASPDDLQDLQREVIAAKRQLRAEGLPEGQP
jgi:phospholipase C